MKLNKLTVSIIAGGLIFAGYELGELARTTNIVIPKPAHEGQPHQEAKNNELATISAKLTKLNIKTDKITKIDDHLLQVIGNGEVFFATADGHFLMFGDVLDISGKVPVNITLEAKSEKVRAEVEAGRSIDFIAPNEKYSVIVFTDISCGYCKHLHKDMQSYLDKGISIHYIAFPRNGLDTQIAETMRGIWNNPNKKALFDEAMNVGSFPPPLKSDTLVTDQYEMARQLGVSATPTLLLPNNQLVPGAISADELLKMLNK